MLVEHQGREIPRKNKHTWGSIVSGSVFDLPTVSCVFLFKSELFSNHLGDREKMQILGSIPGLLSQKPGMMPMAVCGLNEVFMTFSSMRMQ